jgi:head-tail adaptor
MQAGKLDQRITVYAQNVTGQNAFGEDQEGDPTEVCSVWACVEYLQGRELDRATQRWAEARYRITMRRNPSIEIKREHWIEWRDNELDILDVQGQGTRDAFWVITAKDHVE